jgi:hypothetical protein
VLGALLNNNSQPLALLQAGLGSFAGGRLADKEFPLSSNLDQANLLAPLTRNLLGLDQRAIPDELNGPLYSWLNYNELRPPGQLRPDGTPFYDPADKVTDIDELARSLAEQPLPFTENYFPTRLFTDFYQPNAPQITDHMKHPNGIAANPTVTVVAGNGLSAANNSAPQGNTVTIPGYHHMDVVTAAQRQNNGQPEIVSTTLAEFAASL